MSRPVYWISPEATADLDSILDYTALEWSEEQAARYYLELTGGFQFLAKNQSAGKSAEYIRDGYRMFHLLSHVIYYKISEEGPVEIIRILHQNMNTENQFR